MNARTRAAAIWSQLEAELIAAGLSPEKFLIPRAQMIRALGQALKGGKQRLSRIEPEPQPLPAPPLLPEIASLPAAEATRRVHLVEVVDRRLSELLERSCGLRGYDDNDRAEYK